MPTRRHRTPSAEVEGALVDAAERLLEAEGPSALSVRRIAAEAGVSPMGVYNHFEGKDGVVEALFVRSFEGLRAAFADVDGGDPVDDLAEASRRYRRFALDNPTRYSVMFDRAVPDFEPSADAVERAHASFSELVRLVGRAVDTGALVPGDATEMAQRLWEACHGQVSLELRGMGFVADVDGHHDALVATVLRGMATDPS